MAYVWCKQHVSLVWIASKSILSCGLSSLARQQLHGNNGDAAGMQHILEDTEVRGTVLKFANLSSELLAYGSLDGVVRIAQLGASCKICHVSGCLTAEVALKVKPSLRVSQDGTLHSVAPKWRLACAVMPA